MKGKGKYKSVKKCEWFFKMNENRKQISTFLKSHMTSVLVLDINLIFKMKNSDGISNNNKQDSNEYIKKNIIALI